MNVNPITQIPEADTLEWKVAKKRIENQPNWMRQDLRSFSTLELLTRLEAWQYLRLDHLEHQGGREFAEFYIDNIRAELTRRRKLQMSAPQDGYAPSWPSKDQLQQRMQQRIQAVKDRWPIDVFCEQVMFMDLKPVSRGELIGCCPFPDHKDDSPSFRVYPNDSAWCFGCQRGGDIFKLTEYYFRTSGFIDALETCERLSPIGRVA